MLYYTNGRIQDLPNGTSFVRWGAFEAGLALRVARREAIRLMGWEAAPSRFLVVETLVGAVLDDPCTLFSSQPHGQDTDWPRFACFANWALRLDDFSFDRLVSDISGGACSTRWADHTVRMLDQDCCDWSTRCNLPSKCCIMSSIVKDPCLQGTGRVADLVVIPGQPHDFSRCGIGGGSWVPPTGDAFDVATAIAQWLGSSPADTQQLVEQGGGQYTRRSASGQPLPPPYDQATYDPSGGLEDSSGVGLGVAIGALVLLAGVGALVSMED